MIASMTKAFDAEAEPDARQHRHRMADCEKSDVDADLLHPVEEEDDTGEEEEVVVARHHVLWRRGK